MMHTEEPEIIYAEPDFHEFPVYSPIEKIEYIDTSMRPRTPESKRPADLVGKGFVRRRRGSDTSDLLNSEQQEPIHDPTSPDSYPYRFV
jgi:hypothetical protein